jgi:hypothetical protein
MRWTPVAEMRACLPAAHSPTARHTHVKVSSTRWAAPKTHKMHTMQLWTERLNIHGDHRQLLAVDGRLSLPPCFEPPRSTSVDTSERALFLPPLPPQSSTRILENMFIPALMGVVHRRSRIAVHKQASQFRPRARRGRLTSRPSLPRGPNLHRDHDCSRPL